MKFSDPADAALVAEALQRALIYRLLASAFLGPSEARLCELALGAATAAAAARGPLRERLPRPAPAPRGGGPAAAELEFVSGLAFREACALADDEPDTLAVTRGVARAFVGEHLGRWAEAFAASVVGATPEPFHAAAASLLGAWVATEIEALGAVPERVLLPEEAERV